MSQTYIYRSPTTPAGPGWTVDLGNQAVRLGSISGLIMEAELGAVGMSSLKFDDPTGTAGHDGDAIVGLKQFTVNELAADLNNRRIFEGYIADRRYYRGTETDSPSLNTGAARIIDMTLVDLNSFLSFRVFRNGSNTTFNRPAETDVERVQALLDTDLLSGTLFDNGLLSTASPINMDAVDYTSQRPADVLNDCAQQSGKNFFVYYDEVANQFSLFYDFNDSLVYPAYNADLQVSNVLSDVSLNGSNTMAGPVWAPLVDAQLVRDPSRVVAGVYMANGSNSVYETELTTSYTYGFRDAVANTSTLSTPAQAVARADRYLAENSTEDDRLTFTLKLPAANVNDWKEGQYAPVKFSHLPGYTDFVNVRCLCRTVSQDEETDATYNVKYECTPMSSAPSGAFGRWVDGNDFSGIPILAMPTKPGNILLAVISIAGGAATSYTDSDMVPTFLDDPAITGSSWEPPGSDTANWTILGTATVDNDQQPPGEPAHGHAISISVAWRYVQPGETTTHPVAVGAGDAHFSTSTWLWELPPSAVPTLVDTFTSEGAPPTPPHDWSWPTGTGNLLAAATWMLADHGTEEADVTIVSADTTTVQNTQGDNNPANSTTSGWNVPWTWIGQKPSGGVVTVNMATIPAYTSSGLGACGIAVALPPGVTLPTIPYPANQTPG